MRSAGTFSDRLRVYSIIAFLIPGAARLEADQIFFTLTFPYVNLIHGTDPGGVEGLELLVNLDNHGFGSAGAEVNIRDGETIVPNWIYFGEIDPRGRSSYLVPIQLELSDIDYPGGDAISILDISPTGSRTLDLLYDMETRSLSPSGPQTGDEAEAQATLHYLIDTNPFRYDFIIVDQSTETAPGQWSYEYGTMNFTESNFNIERIDIPGIGSFNQDLEPGADYRILPILSNIRPSMVMATVHYADLNGTTRQFPVLAPVEAAPEPSTLALFGIGLAATAGLGFRSARRPLQKP